ncbi:MAG: hypothetical protein DRJ60_03435 [Thermoprotei archaeon]|nr:MAG: hypothetical protein DRJ60_03435 [Thermoprotei archaeon]
MPTICTYDGYCDFKILKKPRNGKYVYPICTYEGSCISKLEASYTQIAFNPTLRKLRLKRKPEIEV